MSMTPAVELLGLLSSTAGEALAPLSKGGLSLSGDIDVGTIANCVTALLAKLGKSDEVLELINRINKQGLVVIVGAKGDKTPMDLANFAFAESHFGEFFDELPGWLTFALGAQFSPFFASLLPPALASAAKAKMAQAMGQTSPTTSAIVGQS
jgi:hypothetical protein